MKTQLTKCIAGTSFLLLLAVAPSRNAAQAAECSDNFDDGVINSALWEVGGEKRGVGGFDSGDWQFSITEVVAADGYLQVRVFGPTSGNTFGADAWVRTKCNYNDGLNHSLNFRWGFSVNADHIDAFAIQISNGDVDNTSDNVEWFFGDSTDTKNLYLTASDLGPISTPCANTAGQGNMSATAWSIGIDSTNRKATLYDGPNLSGNVLCQKDLDVDQAWYVRFIIMDATSAGFPAGDNSLLLYEFSEFNQGCGIDQLVPCAGPQSGGTWRNHGQYVSSVAKAAEECLEAGLITEGQKDAIISQAAQSSCGKR